MPTVALPILYMGILELMRQMDFDFDVMQDRMWVHGEFLK